MTSPRATLAELRLALAAGGDADRAAGQAAYLKGKLKFYGWKGPEVEALFRGWRVRLAEAGPPLEVGLALLDAEHGEEQQLGLLLLHHARARLGDDVLTALEPVFDRRADNWATCDAVSGRVLRWRLPRDVDRARIVSWSDHSSTWRRRAACVSFVNEARHGRYAEDIRRVVPPALALDERFVQLGAGWLLRERWLAAPAEVEALLRACPMRREALRYAIEKMPADLQRELLAVAPRA